MKLPLVSWATMVDTLSAKLRPCWATCMGCCAAGWCCCDWARDWPGAPKRAGPPAPAPAPAPAPEPGWPVPDCCVRPDMADVAAMEEGSCGRPEELEAEDVAGTGADAMTAEEGVLDEGGAKPAEEGPAPWCCPSLGAKRPWGAGAARPPATALSTAAPSLASASPVQEDTESRPRATCWRKILPSGGRKSAEAPGWRLARMASMPGLAAAWRAAASSGSGGTWLRSSGRLAMESAASGSSASTGSAAAVNQTANLAMLTSSGFSMGRARAECAVVRAVRAVGPATRPAEIMPAMSSATVRSSGRG
mmetsp:Transcript_4053/g.16951  ORF Transcript_4053/g.16951 Transcript_4053/m.16951 type:complete len:306 (-) Transcript_4053:1566-2483(-)